MAQELLKNIYLFKGMNPSEMKKITEMATPDVFQTGDEIFSQGDKSLALFVVKFGSIKIAQRTKAGENVDITILSTGSHFGEMGFIDDEPRSASAIAVEKTEVLRLDYKKLSAFLEAEPTTAIRFYKSVSHFLCCRLRTTTADLGFSREINLKHF